MTIHCHAHNAVICGRFNITVNGDYLYTQNHGKLASVCLQRFSSIFESTISTFIVMKDILDKKYHLQIMTKILC